MFFETMYDFICNLWYFYLIIINKLRVNILRVVYFVVSNKLERGSEII